VELLKNEQQICCERVPLICRRGGIPRGPGLHHLPHLHYRLDPAPLSFFYTPAYSHNTTPDLYKVNIKDFCSALAALVGPVKNICCLTVHYFNFFVPIAHQAGQAAVLGRLSLSVCW
jgi:hypothetical protein